LSGMPSGRTPSFLRRGTVHCSSPWEGDQVETPVPREPTNCCPAWSASPARTGSLLRPARLRTAGSVRRGLLGVVTRQRGGSGSGNQHGGGKREHRDVEPVSGQDMFLEGRVDDGQWQVR